MKIITALTFLVLLINGNLFASKANAFYTLDFMDSDAGNIMMDYESLHVPSEDKTYYECMVWDTKTGKSKLYFYNYTDKAFKAYGNNVQLPALPLPNCENDSIQYFMDYTCVHVPSEDKTYYECIVWDAATGTSLLYYYNYTDKAFSAYSQNVQIPSNPLPDLAGNRNMRMNYTSIHVPSEDKTYYECLVWDTKTGTSKLYFYDYSTKNFKAYENNVQLPKNPLPNNNSESVNIYMDYTSVHVPSQDKTYYECLVWDVTTGNSLLYYYNYTDKQLVPYGNNVQIPKNPIGNESEKNTNYFMDYSSVHIPSQDKTYYECIVWNTATGESKLYNYNYTSKTFVPYGDNVQLPAQPLSSGTENLIFMNYTSVHVPSEDKTYYECMVWNAETGTSKLYYYDYTTKGFKAYGNNVQLPATPLE